MGTPWARGDGVALAPLDALPDDPAILRALADGIERGFEGELPALPPAARLYAIRARGHDAGLLAIETGMPEPGAATLVAVVIAVEHRGHAYGAQALFAAERQLRREGVETLYGLVPLTNGRGLYFMLRAGYIPVRPTPEGSTCTRFRRDLATAR